MADKVTTYPTPEELAHWREVAQMATDGPWEVHEHRHINGEFWASIGVEGRGPLTDIIGAQGNKTEYFQPVAGMKYLVTPVEEQKANAQHIATFNPALVLRLLALAEHAGVMRKALEWIACPPEDEFIGQGPAVCIKKARAALAQCAQGEATK